MTRREILAAVANHPAYGEIHYEPVSVDGKTFYQMTGKRLPAMVVSGSKSAANTITYWKEKGWMK